MTEEFILPVVVAELAELAGLTVGGLAHLRYLGRGPRFYKPTPKKVLYKRAEVIAWVTSRCKLLVQTPIP
jgi:hypothetical protein